MVRHFVREQQNASRRGLRFVVSGLVLAALFALAVPAFTAPLYKVGDYQTYSGLSNNFVTFKGYTYFAGGTKGNSGTGVELWRTDGTEAGTTLVQDIYPGSSSSYPEYLTVVRDASDNETLYFAATDNTHGRELWKSDGTPAGTVMVKDLTTTGTGSSDPEDLTAVLGHVVFRSGKRLCVSDGTDAGTVTWTMSGGPYQFVEFNGALYFSAGVDLYSFLFRSDLVAAPAMVANVAVWDLFVMGNNLYFTSDNGGEFWISDGTLGGTSKVLDLPPTRLARLVVVAGSRAFFPCWDSATMKDELWQFSGSGASLVPPLEPSQAPHDPWPLVEVGGTLYFKADDGVHGRELWTYDESTHTARMVKDINPGPGGSDAVSKTPTASFYFSGLLLLDCESLNRWDDRCKLATPLGGSVYFFADDGVHGVELWKTDGTEGGTALVEDLNPGSGSSLFFHGSVRAYSDEYLVLGVDPDVWGSYPLHVLSLRPPRFAIEDVTVPEGNASPSNAVLTVRLIPPSTAATSVQWATSDGTATAGVDYTGATGTLTFPAGTATQPLTVALIPDTTPEVETKTFHVQLSGSSGPPIGRGLADVTIVNDDGPTISIDDITVQENVGTATFTVTLSAATSDAVHVDFATVAGTATSGSDYTAKTGSVTFPPGQLTQPVTVTITNDLSYEPNETFSVHLSHPDYGVLGKADGQCTIVSDDGQPTLTVADVTANEPNTGTGTMTFTATLSAESAFTTTVDYATADGSATAGSDYQAQSGTLTIPAGATSGTIAVPVIGDVIDENNETVLLNLGNAVNATLARTQAIGTIVDNDTARLSVGNVTVVEGAAGTTTVANFPVTLSTPSSFTVTVDYATAPGTTNPATPDVDYTSATGTLSFPPGTTSLTVPVTVIGDSLDEGTSETFFLNLTNPVNATIQTARGTGTITDDDVARFSVADVSVVEGNSGTTNATLTVTMGASLSTDASVKYYTADGSAKVADGDFVGISNNVPAGAVALPFPAGTISQQVTVQVNGDTVKEVNNEYFYLKLVGPTGTTIADAQATITILDDDLQATDRRLSIAPKVAQVTEPSSGETPVTFTVSLFAATGTTPTPSGLPVTVSIVTGGTATPSADYTGVPATLTFAPGTATQTITAAVQADAVLENPETAILTLASPTNATIAAASTTTSGTATLYVYDAVSQETLDFYTVQPCRAVDTREAAKGGPTPIAAGTPRTFTIGGVCGVPTTARAVSVNVTVTGATATGNVRAYPGGTALPGTSNLNFVAGQTRANNAIVLLGSAADITVAVAPAGTAHVVVDVNGYME